MNRFDAWLTKSLAKAKTAITIEIDGTSYNLTSDTTRTASGSQAYFTSTIPTNDRVSATDLTKAINFELVDNEQVTLAASGSFFIVHGPDILGSNGDAFGYATASSRIGNSNAFGPNVWYFKYVSAPVKIPTHLVVNGRAFILTRDAANNTVFYTSTITDSNFQASSSKLSWGINILFSDGTYLNNTRSHLFQTVPGPTPETKAQKVLTLAGVIDWLRAGIITVTKTQVPQQFRTDATTNTTRFQPKCFEIGTASQITALTKVEDCIYMTEKASQ